MPFTIRARCRPVSRGTPMTSPACTGTTTGSLRLWTSVCWQALLSTKRSSSGKLGAVRFGPAWKPSGMPSRLPCRSDSKRLPGHARDVLWRNSTVRSGNLGPERSRRPGQHLKHAAATSVQSPIAPCQNSLCWNCREPRRVECRKQQHEDEQERHRHDDHQPVTTALQVAPTGRPTARCSPAAIADREQQRHPRQSFPRHGRAR